MWGGLPEIREPQLPPLRNPQICGRGRGGQAGRTGPGILGTKQQVFDHVGGPGLGRGRPRSALQDRLHPAPPPPPAATVPAQWPLRLFRGEVGVRGGGKTLSPAAPRPTRGGLSEI